MPQTPPATVAGAIHRTPPSLARELTAVASGGVLGASLRHGVSVLSGAVGLDELLATAIANTVGAFALGILLGRFAGPIRHPLFLSFWGIGVLGSFTTFSTLVSETHGLSAREGGGIGLLHLSLSILTGLIAFALGQKLARRGT
jgi:CrcB protein